MTAEAGKKFMGVLIAEIDHKKECITVRNMSAAPVELAGWRLILQLDKSTYEFPDDVEIEGGSKLTVWCGKKNKNRSFDRSNLWWSAAMKGLGNKDEMASLENARGFVTSKSRPTPLRYSSTDLDEFAD